MQRRGEKRRGEKRRGDRIVILSVTVEDGRKKFQI